VRQICHVTAPTRYGPDQLEQLKAHLDRQDEATALLPADEPGLLELGEDYRTAVGGRKLTAPAFLAVCKRLAPGMRSLVVDLSGERTRRQELPPGCYSPADALAVYNTVLRRRAVVLEGRTLLVDQSEGLIEGLLTPRYRRLSNLSLLERAEGALEEAGGRFESATVVGRRAAFHFLLPGAFARVATPYALDEAGLGALGAPAEVFRRGVYFANSEAGDASCRSAPTLVHARSGARLLAPWGPRGRVRHKGAFFERDLRTLLQGAADPRGLVGLVPPWPARLGQLAEVSLGFTGQDEEHDRQAFARAAQALVRSGARPAVAKQAVKEALLVPAGALTRPADPAHTRRHGWPLRTALDLLVALARLAARQAALAPREEMEQAAWRAVGARRSLADLLADELKESA
jgi:hypothetical protein